MPHIFLSRNNFGGDNRFWTDGSTILQTKHYKPIVLIIGTYNDGLNSLNKADFFYGRNYFWPVISNLSTNNQESIFVKREYALKSGISPEPSLIQILNLCEKLKFSFADLISDVKISLENHSDILINKAIASGHVIDNVKAISNFINSNKSIKHVYFTRKFQNNNSDNYIYGLFKQIQQSLIDKKVTFECLRSPSGQGGFPDRIIVGGSKGKVKAPGIARYWLWANHRESPHELLPKIDGYSHLDHQWLKSCGINVNLF